MLVLKREQRELLADTFKDIANVAAGAIVFGQFLSDGVFSFSLALVGATLWIVFVAFAVGVSGWTTG